MWGFTGRERRKYVRLPGDLEVRFKLNEEKADMPWHKGVTRDISPEGLCLITDIFSKKKWQEIMKKKLSLYLEITFINVNENVTAEAEIYRVDIEAEVIWHRREKDEGKDLCFIGLHFSAIEKDKQETIRRYIIDNLVDKYRPT
jgi:c-di-GMP-binding flagellar brake protein YcgR